MTEELLTPTELCRKILDVAWHGDYSNGNEAFGTDEGQVMAHKCLEDFEAQLAKVQRLRLDRADREKVLLDVLVQNCPFVDGCQRQCTPTDQEDCYSHFTKPLLAIMPTEEENLTEEVFVCQEEIRQLRWKLKKARKQERERIIKVLEDALEDDFVMAIADPEGEPMESTIDPTALREILKTLKDITDAT